MDLFDKILLIETKEDFLEFLEIFIKQISLGEEEIINDNYSDFLEGIIGATYGLEGYYLNNKIKKENVFPSWRAFALIIYGASCHS